MKLLEDLWSKDRHLISDSYDNSLEYISKILSLKIIEIPSGKKCWTWTVPEKWNINEAWIKDSEDNKLLDLNEHPLHVLSYSLPIDKTVTKEELMLHLYTNPKRPKAIPFNFKYYERDWGFCIQHERLSDFKDEQYHVKIDSSFEKGNLKIGELDIPGQSENIIVLMAHLCHPSMVNDDLAGVAVLVDLAKTLQEKRNFYSYKILFVPETIGSVAYLSQNEQLIPKMKSGIFLEMLGTNNSLVLQKTKQGNSHIDRISKYVLKKNLKEFREGDFHKIVVNDEMVFNGPGVNVPMISISRFPYPEYHTSDDNLSIISNEKLSESKEIIVKILDILDKNYVPERKFMGPIFLSGFGLWVDYKENKELNDKIDEIMLLLEGDHSVFDIAERLNMDFYDVLTFLEKLEKNDLISKKDVFDISF